MITGNLIESEITSMATVFNFLSSILNMDRFFVEKIWSEHPIFYWAVPVHTVRFFIGDKNWTYHTIFNWSVIWSTQSDFLLELLCCDTGILGPIVGLRHSDWSRRTRSNFLSQIVGWKVLIFIGPKVAHTI